MLGYILRRLVYMVPLLLGVTFITFILFHLVGGNPCYQKLGKHADAESIALCETDLGLNRPLAVQYLHVLKETVTFEFGRSFSTNQKISKMILEGAVPSLLLSLPAFIIGTLLGLTISLISAFLRAKFFDKFLVFMSVMGMSVTSLAYIIAGQYFLAYKWGLFPISGYEGGLAAASYLALPVLIWVVVGLGYDVRLYRTVVLDEINQDYVRTAWAKGLSRRRVLFKHVLMNAMIPIITQVVIAIPFLMTGSMLLENFFQIPGLGSMVVTAVQNSDFPVLKAFVLISSISFLIFHLISDVLYALVDPRIRLG